MSQTNRLDGGASKKQIQLKSSRPTPRQQGDVSTKWAATELHLQKGDVFTGVCYPGTGGARS